MFTTTVLAFALAQARTGEAPALDNRRFPEDYRGLADGRAADAWWARYKDLPLDQAGRWRFSFGLELRSQTEVFRGDGLRAEEDEALDYTWWRALPVFELRNGPWRGFVQLIFAAATGLDTEPSPIDANRGDFLQAFLEAPLGPESSHLSVRAGRQLLAFGSQRLVGYRYGPNVPLPFDGAVAAYDDGRFRAEALWVRPVATEPGAFDDEANDEESLYGLYTTTLFGRQGLDLYYLGHDDDLGIYDQGAADEERHTFGARWFGGVGMFDWNGEIFGQIGSFGDDDIRAWSATIEAGVLFEEVATEPRGFGRLSVISGDDDRFDDELNTFNALYPRGKYFGEIGTIGPANLIDVLVGAQLEIGGGWVLDASSTAYWRESLDDGIYANNGQLLRSGAGSDERFVGLQGDIAFTQNITRTTSWTVGYSVFDGGAFVEDTGPSDPVHFFQLAARLLF
ncbi:MAG: alginate export family protein [Planctomycetota bacterium]